MGEVIRMADYLERKPGEIDRSEIPKRIAQITFELLTLQSEKNRLEHLLFLPPTEAPDTLT